VTKRKKRKMFSSVSFVVSLSLLVCVATAMEMNRPPVWEAPETARWLMHQVDWGTVSTSSAHLDGVVFFAE